MERVKWIDGAKGIAILMVIVVHLSQVLPGLPCWMKRVSSFGAMGVQLFFMMSAYCVCMTWRPERFTYRYWWRKYKRLIVWYATGVVTYYLYGLCRGSPDVLSAYTIENVVANILLINGFVPSAQNSIVPGGWSISCIALFVFIFPVLAFMPRKGQLLTLILASILGGGVSFMGYRYLGWSRFYSYCVPINQIAPFAFGVILWQKNEWLKARTRPCWALILSALAFFAAVASVILSREVSIFYRQILVSLSFLFGIILLERYERCIPVCLAWVGKYSYEIFILHFVVLWTIFR